MPKIERFTKDTLQAFRPELEKALDEVAARYGVELKLKTIRFDPDGSAFAATIEGKSAAAESVEQARFVEMAGLYGIDHERVIDSPQGKLKLAGYDPRKRSKPWRATLNGRPGYILPHDYVMRAFKKDAA